MLIVALALCAEGCQPVTACHPDVITGSIFSARDTGIYLFESPFPSAAVNATVCVRGADAACALGVAKTEFVTHVTTLRLWQRGRRAYCFEGMRTPSPLKICC